MKVIHETSLRDFDFWSGAQHTADELTWHELDQIEAFLEDAYPEGMSATDINDMFRFEQDFIASCIGYEDWEHFSEVNHPEQYTWACCYCSNEYDEQDQWHDEVILEPNANKTEWTCPVCGSSTDNPKEEGCYTV